MVMGMVSDHQISDTKKISCTIRSSRVVVVGSYTVKIMHTLVLFHRFAFTNCSARAKF